SHAQIIDVTRMPPGEKVIFGATVELLDLDTDAEIRYKIVGDDEADIKQDLISIHSPIARALIGKSVGDEVTFNAPGGNTRTFEIVEVEYLA
ncbi:MAG TPA: transcription elongation factor GreA, partial [Halothiobacillaceae bacterium]|nr:transcription elongation factor GreA [Halothiobacillaceae bacterium]